jgi:hypothetical protein
MNIEGSKSHDTLEWRESHAFNKDQKIYATIKCREGYINKEE